MTPIAITTGRRCFVRLAHGLCAGLALVASTTTAGAVDLGQGERAHRATLRMDLEEARSELATLPENDADAIVGRAFLALYEGKCDAAATLLARGQVASHEATAYLAEIARGCARVTSSTVQVRDEARGLLFVLKDEDDAPLVPYLADVADRARGQLERDLGVVLPKPLRIDLVRDQYSLSAMTGLPEESAQTTGTVAVAKWGRVTMVSPRAAPYGYPWADTLMHELTHLAVARGSADRAPLWLQEGVAKREEVRWRSPFVLDDDVSPDAVARRGFEKGLGLPLDQLGPSIAMLPSAEQAVVAFSEVTSFVGFWVHENGDTALPRLIRGLDAGGDQQALVNATLKDVSGGDLKAWNEKWRAYLATTADAAAADAILPHRDKSAREISRRAHLGDLLADRGHPEEALSDYSRMVELAPHDPTALARLAHVLRALGRADDAHRHVISLEGIHMAHGLYLELRGEALETQGDLASATESRDHALWQSPLEPDVACELVSSPESPKNSARAALCDAARRASQH